MKPKTRTRKWFILPVAKVRKAKEVLVVETETNTVERALDLVIADGEIRKALLSMKGSCNMTAVLAGSYICTRNRN